VKVRALALVCVAVVACGTGGDHGGAPARDDGGASVSPAAVAFDAARMDDQRSARDAAPALGPDAALDGSAGDVGSAPAPSEGLQQLLLSSGIGLGYYHSCMIMPTLDVKCWGLPMVRTNVDPRPMPPAIETTMIYGTHNGFCALVAPGKGDRLRCWGYNFTFAPPQGMPMDPLQFGMGYDHGCVLNRDRSVACWGAPGTMSTPPPGLRAKSLAVAAFFTCAVREDNTVACWGVNPPAPPSGLKVKLVAITTHGIGKLPVAPTTTRHACAIKRDDDTITCWGDGDEGELAVPPGTVARDVAVATFRTCVVRPDGAVQCWGKAYAPERDVPMPGGLKLKAIKAKMGSFCGLQMDDTVVCWGDQQHVHLMIPPGTKVYVPPS
jgi:hypothetical protein